MSNDQIGTEHKTDDEDYDNDNETSNYHCCSLACCVFNCLVIIFPAHEVSHESYQDSNSLTK